MAFSGLTALAIALVLSPGGEQRAQSRGSASPAVAPDSVVPRVLRAFRIGPSAIDLDGRLDDEAWRRADMASGFTQRNPNDGAPATERTEVRVAYTGSAVYVGVRAFDSEPDHIRSRLARRDAISQSDQIWLYFDSYHDRLTCFQFGVTPGGSTEDAYGSDDNSWGDSSWDPVWEVKTSVDSLGWSAEFRIPFTQLRFDRKNSEWGFQVARRIERKAENVYWAPWSKNESGFASRFGVLENLHGLPSPMRLEVRPYTVASNRWRPEPTGSLYAPTSLQQLDAGLDLKYGLTSDFTLDLAVNPDFGQVEADPAVVNLTAFESYFPEKRPFFVEGAALFNRWVPGGQLFYSRRIGRPPQGWAGPPDGGTVQLPEATTIVSAAKVTGKSSGGLGLGVMSAVTTAESATLRDSTGEVVGSKRVQPLGHSFAARVQQDFREGSHTVGGMVTAVNQHLGDEFGFLRSAAYVGVVDGRHRWKRNMYGIEWLVAASHLRGSEEAIRSAQRSPFRYYQRPDADHVELDTTRTSLSGYAFSLNAGKQAGTWRYFGYYEWISPGFDISDMGFQWSGDRQEASAGLYYFRTRPVRMFRNFQVGANFSQTWTTAGEALGTWVRPVHFYATFTNNWTLSLNPLAFAVNRFSVSALRGGPGLKLNDWRNSFVYVATDSRKPVSLGIWGSVGGVLGTPERWADIEPELNVRPSGFLAASLGVSYAWSRDPTQWIGRRVVADSTRYLLGAIEQRTLNLTSRVDVTLTPTLSIQLYAQPFVSSGRYGDFKEVVAPLAPQYADRYRLFGDELTCADLMCDVDLDADGTADLSFDQPDFNFKSLRSTLVLRWEYRPGSVLYVAWQHGRSHYVRERAFRAFGDLADLLSLEADNTLLVKFNYWLSF